MSLRAGVPRAPVVVPEGLASVVGDRQVTPVWQNELGGITVQLGRGRQREFLKWAPLSGETSDDAIDDDPEARRLRWAGRYTSVPRVLDLGRTDEVSWLLTAGLPGRSALDARWLVEPETAVRAIATGLRTLHDSLPVADCPFSWSDEDRIPAAHRRAAAGLDTSTWHPEHQSLSAADVLRVLGDPPPIDTPVVCHGDACSPNTLLDDDGSVSGHVDLGALGVADRWADLAVGLWSVEWNYGAGWDDVMLDAYGIPCDAERAAYYRLLWDAT